jgi:hypothetical protein
LDLELAILIVTILSSGDFRYATKCFTLKMEAAKSSETLDGVTTQKTSTCGDKVEDKGKRE